MLIKHLLLISIVSTLYIYSSWHSIIEQKKSNIDKTIYTILTAQLEAYSANRSPKIADAIIKNIPIIESDEALVNCTLLNHARIIMLPSPLKPFESSECNSGFKAASYIRTTVFNKLVIMLNNLDKLAFHFGYKPNQLCIKIFEGLRDITTQRMLFENKLQEIRSNNPSLSDDEAIAETSKWVSPVHNNIPVHATGGAVDIRIWDNYNNQFLDVGPFGVIWGPNTTAQTFSENITDAQKLNRLYILVAAMQAGLINYSYEHWHFSHGDRYATFWLMPNSHQSQATYGLIDIPK